MTDSADDGRPGLRAGLQAGSQAGSQAGFRSDSQGNSERGSEPVRRGADLARDALEAARARRAGGQMSAAGGAARGTGAGKGTGARGSGAANRGSGAALRLRRRRWSGPGADKARDPQRVGDVLAGWLQATGAGREVTRARLFERWAEIVGPEIADHAEPVSLVDGELVVQAESTAWATQLRLLAAGMIRRINAEIGKSAVVRIKTQGPAGPSWRFGNRHISGRGPRDTYG